MIMNIGMNVIETTFGALLLIIFMLIIQILNSIEFKVKQKKIFFISVFPVIYSFILVFLIRLINTSFRFLPDNTEFYFAIMSSFFCLLHYYYFKKCIKINMEKANSIKYLV